MSTLDLIQQIKSLNPSQQWEVVMEVMKGLKPVATAANPGGQMSMEEFKQRIDEAEADIQNGQVFSTQQVRDQWSQWK